VRTNRCGSAISKTVRRHSHLQHCTLLNLSDMAKDGLMMETYVCMENAGNYGMHQESGLRIWRVLRAIRPVTSKNSFFRVCACMGIPLDLQYGAWRLTGIERMAELIENMARSYELEVKQLSYMLEAGGRIGGEVVLASYLKRVLLQELHVTRRMSFAGKDDGVIAAAKEEARKMPTSYWDRVGTVRSGAYHLRTFVARY